MDHSSVFGGNISFTTVHSIKNSREQRNYEVIYWPGNIALRNLIYVDPFTAVLCWITTHGACPGPVFCEAKVSSSETFIDPNTV